MKEAREGRMCVPKINAKAIVVWQQQLYGLFTAVFAEVNVDAFSYRLPFFFFDNCSTVVYYLVRSFAVFASRVAL